PGANLGESHTLPMSKGLFELRLKSQEGIARVMCCTLVGKRIVMLHSFVKKTALLHKPISKGLFHNIIFK
ncbi:type II toxin-antitoxin system RelE/ParE family toxin, partial [Acinetobacter baumannii]|uniref:type II toxin-antitoxin system RelE/ParE family toxin n=2 Tax=Acinetobacter TaxID=469 RepID=UPI000D4F0F6E